MTAWLDPLRKTLDEVATPVPFFIRDDDAGWADSALWALLDRLAAAPTPVDVAVIPALADRALLRGLARRREESADGSARLAVHPHGWAHRNHEPVGRKCEFGPSRTLAEQREDLARGRAVLLDAFGPDAGQVFVPPWNRCTSGTVSLLPELGFVALSRDTTAGREQFPGLAEVPVTVDWFAKRRGTGGPVDREERGHLLAEAARAVDGGAARGAGVMLHHAVTDPDDLADVGELVDLLATHDRVVPVLMADLL